jgi:hypothetical protein
MKKAFFILSVLIVFFSCQKKENPAYKIANNSTYDMSNVEVYEFDGEEVVNNPSLGNLEPGEVTRKVTVKDNVNRVKVKFKVSWETFYTYNYYSLSEGDIKVISIDDETLVTNELKSGTYLLLNLH